jgi:hypothetical protein
MSRTERPTVSRLAGGAGLALAVSLAGCGGTGDGSATQAPETAAVATATPAAAAADFCDQAAGIDERVDAALPGPDGGDPAIADAFRQLAVELRAIDAPEAIAPAWAGMSVGLDRMADAFAGADVTDLDSLAALDRAEQDLTAASSEVEDYLSDECGL